MKRHGRLETHRNADGTFWLRLVAANGKVLMHSEQLAGRQVRRARRAIQAAFQEDERAYLNDCACAGCERQGSNDV